MKRKVLSLIICFLLFLVSGCENTTETKESDKLKIITSVFPLYDFTKNLCGDLADVSLLVPPGNDSHHFEPKPHDIIDITNADLFIYIGGIDEKWIEDILSASNIDKNKTLPLLEDFDIISREIHDSNHSHNEYDEHLWTSVNNSVKLCDMIYSRLVLTDKENSEAYKNNHWEYTKKLLELSDKFSEVIDTSKRKTIVFGDKFPFYHFVCDYDLKYYSAFPGCSDEVEPSASNIAMLTNIIKSENIPAVFYIEFSNERVADILCEENGIKKLLFHSCHSVTQKEFDNNISYISLMENNLINLKEALN